METVFDIIFSIFHIILIHNQQKHSYFIEFFIE